MRECIVSRTHTNCIPWCSGLSSLKSMKFVSTCFAKDNQLKWMNESHFHIEAHQNLKNMPHLIKDEISSSMVGSTSRFLIICASLPKKNSTSCNDVKKLFCPRAEFVILYNFLSGIIVHLRKWVSISKLWDIRNKT